MSKKDIFDVVLDEEEQEIYDAAERGELKSVDNLAEEIAFAKSAASNYFKKSLPVKSTD